MSTAQPERRRQSTAQRAQRAEFIERSETVDGRRSGGYRARAKHGRRQSQDCALVRRAGWSKNVVEHASSRYEQETPAPDASVKTFERDDALWFDNAYSDVVP